MTRKSRRLALVVSLLLVAAGTATLAMVAFRSSMVFFVGPSELAANPGERAGKALRVGGLVEGAVLKTGSENRFKLTDGKAAIDVHYVGILPNLVGPGQGVVVEGRLADDHVFEASVVLAKHDEKYMPPDVVDALKRSGQWQGK